MNGVEKNGFKQLADIIGMPTRFECYETMGDIVKLALRAYFAGYRDACGWIKKEPINAEE
jgi:hypothetical protein